MSHQPVKFALTAVICLALGCGGPRERANELVTSIVRADAGHEVDDAVDGGLGLGDARGGRDEGADGSHDLTPEPQPVAAPDTAADTVADAGAMIGTMPDASPESGPGPVADTSAPEHPIDVNGSVDSISPSETSPEAPSEPLGPATWRLALGGRHSCLLRDGVVQCWGFNQSGQLGNGGTADSSLRVTVSGLTGVKAIAAGGLHTCAILASGAVACWGSNAKGQLGNGTNKDSAVPVMVPGLSDVRALTASTSHTCAAHGGGSIACWGGDGNFPLGDGVTFHSAVPVAVKDPGGGNRTFQVDGYGLTAGELHTCALVKPGLMRPGSLWCWGASSYGQVGNGGGGNILEPVQVGIFDAESVGCGGRYTCVTLTDGTARCWGRNVQGALGNGKNLSSTVPVEVVNLAGATMVRGGLAHTCALTKTGQASCWGANDLGQLGDGSSADSSNVPVNVAGITTAIELATGDNHTCAVLTDSSVACWGNNSAGQLGGGIVGQNARIPVKVLGI
jgi:hypothetical protein